MSWQLNEVQNHLSRHIYMEPELFSCAECGDSINSGIQVDDDGDKTFFCSCHFPKNSIDRWRGINEWYERHTDLNEKKRYGLIITDF